MWLVGYSTVLNTTAQHSKGVDRGLAQKDVFNIKNGQIGSKRTPTLKNPKIL